ncbi:HAMP domain-containing sensor histidine kinase [Tepidibacter aestuarii]|uniref:HAMP domain-containing sensor histidine kinase n=1 Tax=Tepidibacter aestuarii TaxID=2925782 RepID=UPI0020C04FC6|nr:HAMP domain-containing sensor histidine kinase [Tepidibacter aestuarii]CAH2212382.1 Histidine kinase [Tepidibacter aestuarii]
MKFWKKIFTYNFILFVIIFNLGGVFLIENMHSVSLDREIERGLSEHLSIYSGMKLIGKYRLNYDEKFNKDMLRVTMKDFLKSFHNEKIYVEVLDRYNNTIFTNLDFRASKEREELKNPYVDKRKYVIRDVGDKTLLFITNLLDASGEQLKFTYVRDVTYIYKDREKVYYFFIKLDIIISIILACGTYVLSRYITKPIDKLINSIQIIENGNFSERVNIKSNDEIGILSDHFNKMASVIEEKMKQLKKNIDEKQSFIDNLTHEIKTPLTSIIGYADFLRNTKYNEDAFSKGLNSIFKEGKRLEGLSSKMMDLIVFKRENFVMKKENIKNILMDIKEVLKPKLQNKNIELIISGQDMEIVMEKDLIENLIINLIDNAVKASYENSKINIKLYKNENSKSVIEVSDQGIGIKDEDLTKVFEPFYMVDKSRKKTNGSAGLGLSICEQIAKIHKAKLSIESKLNIGTSVKIIFD